MKILALLQLPPPVHGASRMNRLSLDVLKEEYPHTKAINIGLANDASDVNSLSISKLLKFIKLLGSVWLYSFKVRPDQIYASISPTGGAFIKDFMFLFVAKLMKIPIKFHIHGNGISNFYNKKVYRKLYNFLLEGETLIVLSPELKKEYSCLNITCKYHILPNFNFFEFDTSVLNRNLDADRSDIVKPLNVLFFSNLRKGKGIFDFYIAIRNIIKNREDVSVTIAGPWSSERDEKELMTQIKNDSIELGLDLMQKINFLGPIKGDVSKLNLYKNSDVFVFPSYIDTFPLVVLEAMELGVPVIAYEQGAIVDMLSQGSGVVVEKGNINMLEASIESLLESDSTRVATAKSAAGRVKNLYSRDNYKLNFLKMFKGCK